MMVPVRGAFSACGTWPERKAGEKHLLVLHTIDQENPIFSIVELQESLRPCSCPLKNRILELSTGEKQWLSHFLG